MKKKVFFDLKNDGHHWKYNINVIKSKISNDTKCIYYTSSIDSQQKEILKNLNVEIKEFEYKSNNKFNIIFNFIILLKVILFCKKNKVDELYILYLDPFIIQINILRSLFKKKVVGTLHWYPDKKIKIKILHKLKKKIIIVVHTEEILKKMKKDAILIYYPKFENEEIKNMERKDKKNITILYFGALRLDKGVDILLESFKYTNSNFNFIIAGKESTFSKKFVEEKIKDINPERYIIDIDYISEEKMKEYYDMSDVVVLAYRKHFLGESGILIDSISKGKVIISTPISNAKEIINKYNNGELINFDDYKMLAEKIDKIVNNFDFYSKNVIEPQKYYLQLHSLERFINEYKKI